MSLTSGHYASILFYVHTMEIAIYFYLFIYYQICMVSHLLKGDSDGTQQAIKY